MRKLNDEQVDAFRAMARTGASWLEIADAFSYSSAQAACMAFKRFGSDADREARAIVLGKSVHGEKSMRRERVDIFAGLGACFRR